MINLRVDKIWGLDPSEELNKMAALRWPSEEGLEVDFIISGG